MRAPDWDWNSLIVDPPLPIIHPAAVFDTRNLKCVGLTLSSAEEHDLKIRSLWKENVSWYQTFEYKIAKIRREA
jgi:hypothetical protein